MKWNLGKCYLWQNIHQYLERWRSGLGLGLVASARFQIWDSTPLKVSQTDHRNWWAEGADSDTWPERTDDDTSPNIPQSSNLSFDDQSRNGICGVYQRKFFHCLTETEWYNLVTNAVSNQPPFYLRAYLTSQILPTDLLSFFLTRLLHWVRVSSDPSLTGNRSYFSSCSHERGGECTYTALGLDRESGVGVTSSVTLNTSARPDPVATPWHQQSCCCCWFYRQATNINPPAATSPTTRKWQL